METTLKQKIGIVLLGVGVVLALGFNWLGPLVVFVAIVCIVVGLTLALTRQPKGYEYHAKWVHDTTHHDDE